MLDILGSNSGNFGTMSSNQAAINAATLGAHPQRHVTGIFRNRDSAEQAFQVTLDRGYSRDEVHLIISDETRKRYFPDTASDGSSASKAAEGAGIGAGIGGALGAITAALVAVGTSLVVPSLGLVIAGPIVAALAGAGTGGIAGGLVGALVGYGIPEERAKLYETAIKEGGVVISVSAHNDEDAAYLENQWKALDGDHIHAEI